MTYLYPMTFEYEGDNIIIHSVDIPEAYSDANTINEAYKNAKEVLQLSLKSRLQDNDEIPVPSDIRKLKANNGFVSLVEVVCESKIKYDKKTLTVPRDLNKMAKKAGINFSQLLQKAILEELTKC